MPPIGPPHHPGLPIPEISFTITFFSICILWFKRNRFSFDRWFVFFLLALSCLHLAHLLRRGFGKAYFDFFHIPQLLFGPLFFLYLKDILGIGVKKKVWIHFIPYLFFTVLFLILKILPDTDGAYSFFFGPEGWGLKISTFVSLIGYSIFSYWNVSRVERENVDPVLESLQWTWLKILIVLVLGIVTYHGLTFFWNDSRPSPPFSPQGSGWDGSPLPPQGAGPEGHPPGFPPGLGSGGPPRGGIPSIRGWDVLVFTILFSLFGIRQSMIHSAWLLGQNLSSDLVKKRKYERSGLEEGRLKNYVQIVQEHMKTDKPYLDSEFSLDHLADRLNFPRAHITQALSEILETNFYNFVNEYRVNEFIRLVDSSPEEKIAVLSLAFDAGFNSKSTFNQSFKRIMGTTPSLYLAEKRQKKES
ncbi:helix-turn-helix domain-containing protein [Leptospira kmetyi]|uniref:helix-turn-helix domain-containing protein n=1 Tax=Leptospira kmetyi TaxID=408139 RepID=UPI001083E165|nr:helix-turn-helix domain-containing protein [Leptospira kmetyi]TGK17702.1 AraC family transcriptional regulator [Leptospira kmetyi]TGK25038.1 AraC family transcriptional regulator [Leptospira kmetyi]